MENKVAIAHIDSVMSNYENPLYVDKTDSSYRLCQVWISKYDIEAFDMAKKALRGEESFMDFFDLVDKVSTKTTENMESFIFETISPFCNEVTQMEISKDELTQALMAWRKWKVEDNEAKEKLEKIKQIVNRNYASATKLAEIEDVLHEDNISNPE
jgi:hypothetical protein